jgi:pimeloyl-ACP methyl ester carboxylesterase
VTTAIANGIGIYYEVRGSGPPVLLILGLAADISEFGRIIDPLAERFTVLAFDNRGSGRSDKPRTPYAVPLMASDTALVMKAAGFEHANVVGISLGGRIALELSLQHPELVDRLVLVSTAARVPRSLRRTLMLSVLPRLPLFKGRYPQPYYAFANQRDASRGYDCSRRLGEIHAPTLILHGTSDRSAPFALARELQAGIPDATLIAFSGGHLFFLFGGRDRFLDATARFLSG